MLVLTLPSWLLIIYKASVCARHMAISLMKIVLFTIFECTFSDES